MTDMHIAAQEEAASPVAGRACGACMLCCKALPLPDETKPAGRWCPQARPGRGCAIHAERPDSCRAFACIWMTNPGLDDSWKPDRARFLLATYPGTDALAVVVDPAQPGAWRRAPYEAQIRAWAEKAIEARSQVLLVNGRKVSIVLPNAEIDVGVLEPGDSVDLMHDGARFQARVRKAGA